MHVRCESIDGPPRGPISTECVTEGECGDGMSEGGGEGVEEEEAPAPMEMEEPACEGGGEGVEEEDAYGREGANVQYNCDDDDDEFEILSLGNQMI